MTEEQTQAIMREYECCSCGDEVTVPDHIPFADINDWLEENGWIRAVNYEGEFDGQYLCEDCHDTSTAGDEGD